MQNVCQKGMPMMTWGRPFPSGAFDGPAGKLNAGKKNGGKRAGRKKRTSFQPESLGPYLLKKRKSTTLVPVNTV